MVFRRFLIGVATIASILVSVVAGTFFFLDEFGLFRPSNGRTIGIYTSERTAKYLLSMRYIPENFDAVMIGTSFSDQLDTKEITSFRMYNLSLLGANSAELAMLVGNVMEVRPPRLLLICLDPFMLRNTEIHDVRMTPSAKWATLGSTFIIEYYRRKLRKVVSGKRDIFEYTTFGSATINDVPVEVSRQAINDRAKAVAAEKSPLLMDPAAIRQLKNIIQEARKAGVRIAAFFYPHPEPVRLEMASSYLAFSQEMLGIFRTGEILLDFNGTEYLTFRKDPANYTDGAHISTKGGRFLLAELDSAISRSYKGPR